MSIQTLPARLLIVALLLQALAYYAVASRRDVIPTAAPLSDVPRRSGPWTTIHEYPMEKGVQDVLRADDTLNRQYVNDRHTTTPSLFIAFFKTQRYGQAPHSPKNCLPGAGWQPSEDRKLSIAVAGRPDPIVVNEYVISRGADESLVLYWYQSRSRVIAGEFAAKFWLVADAIRYHRSDTALVRIIVPVRGETTRDAAERQAVDLAQATFPDIVRQLPQ
jgi:EpsI family protein